MAESTTGGIKNALPRPQLNGMSTYNNMGKTYYLVGFYSSQSCTDTATCLAQQSPTRFLLKVVTPRWTASNYSLMWQTDLAINNQEALTGSDIKALVDFTQLAETPLTVGDEIDISYESQQTTIAVNKVIAIRTKNKTLFNYISRVWLGPIPPSKQFQANLLVGHGGHIEPQLRSEFEQIKPSPKRLSLLDHWSTAKTINEAQQHDDALVSAEEKGEPLATAEIKAQEEALALELLVAATTKTAKQITTTTPTSALPQANVKPKTITTQTRKAPNLQGATDLQKTTDNDAAKAALADAKKDIITNISRHVIYPEWAKQFQQQGKITVHFTVNQLGALTSIDEIKPVHAGLLGEAVIAAIKKTFPVTLQNEALLPVQWRMHYQHIFAIGDTLTKPPSAAHQPATSIPATQKNNDDLNHDGSLVADIAAHITYPYWARNLNQGGNVTITFKLDHKGYITDYKIINGSKHPGLNDAVINGAKKSQPFNSQRIQINNGKLEFTLSHDFQP
ncbi:MAG: TonB family protein [Marinagarivorans sp.]|nr:TonB family protein [Marinagarivorans sp.]